MAKGTVSVNLKRGWFGPGGSLHEVRDNPHTFPEAWAGKPKKRPDESTEDFKAREASSKYERLPSTAEVVEDAPEVEDEPDADDADQA